MEEKIYHKINLEELLAKIRSIKKKSFLNIDSTHFNKVMQNVQVETLNKDQSNIFYQKINVTIPDFFKFSDNHFYNNPNTSNFNIYKKNLINNNFNNYQNIDNDLDILEDFIETNSYFSNFSKNFCRFILHIFKDLTVLTQGKIINEIVKNPSLFYKLYVTKMYEIYSKDSFSYMHERHIKLIDFNQNLQRNAKNQVSILSDDNKYILNFILP